MAEENGKYLNPEDYTIITNEDLNKKINKAWQDGIYYLNGNKYDGLAGGILSTSAYVEAGKGYVDRSGLADIVLGLGLSTAAIRGSTTFGKKSSGLDVPEETVTYRRVQGGDSKDLLLVNDDGTLSLNSTWKSEHNLNVSTGQDHANYFQGKRPDSYVVEFEVPQYLDDLIRENAISQNGYKTNPLNQGGAAPKIVDKGVFDKFNFEGVAYELPDPINQWLVEYAKKARIVK